MQVLVGLGNPGDEYARNRHNIGFMAVMAIARRYGFGPWRKRFDALTCEGTVDGEKILAVLPQTYMNLSGQAVGAAAGFFKVPAENVFVIHDELDLPPGKVRVKKGGSSGGHNGLRSIDQHLGVDYWRVRLGIGHPGHRDLVTGYVLHDFAKNDGPWLESLLESVAEAYPLLVAGQPEKYATRLAMNKQPPSVPNDTF